jgi:hypothetical protein
MSKKNIKFNKSGIDKIPNDKPILYKILTLNNSNNYTGVAKRGRAQARLIEHYGEIPGAKIEVEQFSSIRAAERKEKNILSRVKPKYNVKGK